ncbi:T9SS type A sorting domain-containing protein [Nubsella zeaxanthinifaciens]|uniref:T9SS type A sorting domain-containing protein n=1 Tax=Nubsella zeaxanthinifaciens TaxID=392412 RepID=UPI000DE2EE46|nr:T9SS type A sorting domain-containing protein [Nubsella zeaxanthinifaciens]
MQIFTKVKTLLLLLFLFVSVKSTFAQVTITQPTGGVGISTDKAVGGNSAGYTAIGDIIIADQTAGDFQPGTDRKIYLVPSQTYWQIEPGVGSVSFGGTNITAASILVQSNLVTVTYSVTGTTANDNFITISGIAVQSTTTLNEATIATLRRSTTAGANSGTIAGFVNNTVVANLSEVAGTYSQLQVLLPGETAAPGTVSGKTGTPTNRNSGTQFAVTVNAVDAYWNRITTNTNTVQITSSDANATLPVNNTLAAGTRNFNITLRTVGTSTVSATNVTLGAPANASSNVSVVTGPFARLQLLLPGETGAPGTTTGKTGTPIGLTAGTAFNVTVNAVDAGWNVVNTVTDEIRLTSTDANATMPANLNMVNGVANFSGASAVTLLTAGNRTVTATNITDGTKTASTSPTFALATGAYSQLQVLLPGETAAPGTLTGKTGTATDRTSGTQFAITVNAVDAYFNRITTNTNTIQITSNDVNGTMPANNTLAAGTRAFNVTLRSLGSITLNVSNVTLGTPANSRTANVVAGPFVKLQLLLPGETAAPGTTTGKTGTPTGQVAGTSFNVTVNAVDAAWNIITTVTDQIRLTSTDANATMPANLNMVNGVANFSGASTVTLVTAGNRTITATNFTDGTKTASTSPAVVVAAGTFSKLLVTLPGETLAAGTATGKTGTPNAVNAGAVVLASVYAVDANFNRVSGNADIINITSSDPSATLPANNTLAANGARAFNVTLVTPGSISITATNTTNPGGVSAGSSTISVIGGVFTKLQILLPGETAAPGTTTGKTGTPIAQVAGTPFTVKVRAVDAAWNLATGISHTIRLTSTDANATMPADFAMDPSGEVVLTNVSLVTAGNRTLTASDITDPTKTASTSPTVVVNVGAYSKLQVLLPGETAAPGTLIGKTGTPTARVAGTAFNITVNAVDANWNRITTNTNTVQITSSDVNAVLPANAPLVAGTKNNFSITLRSVGAATITATNVTAGGSANSASVNVATGAFVKLQLLLPGETAAPGTTTGKTGTPTAQLAGTPFNVTINAVDAAWNIVNTVTDVVNFTATNDAYAQLPAATALSAGTLTTSVTYRIGAATVNKRLTVADQTDNTKTASQSALFAVNINTFSKLLIILPGETYVAGHPNGKTGTPSNQAAGVNFNITVRATDAAFNTVTTVTDVVGITSTDAIGVMPANAPLASGVKANFTVRLNTISNSNTLTATDITDGTKTAYTTGGILVVTASSATDYFRSAVATGNWNTSASWETSANGVSGWQPSTLVPTNTASRVTVRSGNNISVTANATVDDVLIESNAQLTLTGGTLTIASGPAFIVQGTLRNNGRPITVSGVLQVDNGGKYQHNFTTTAGTIPTATWNTGAICEVIGYTTFAGDVLGSNQTFSDFVWNNTAQTGASTPALVNNFTARNFTVTSTGSGALNLASTGGTATITGDYTQTTGSVVVNKTSGTQNLNVAGNFAVNGGAFSLGAGTVNITYNGTTQSLSNAGTEIQFSNVTFTNGGTKTLTSGSFSIATDGVLNMGASTTLNANGNLTILSSASGTGRVAAIPSGAAITGNVTVQRFVTGGTQDPYRTFRMFSSPVYDNGNPSNRTYSFNQFIDDMIVTGTGGSINGFDNSSVNSASAWTYNAGFVAVTNINTAVNVGKGSYLYYRGDRSNISGKLTSPYVDPENSVLDFVGVLNQQNVAVSLSSGGNLVGNPYASSIDWNSAGITKSGLTNNIIRIWNPASRSYATYDGAVGVPAGVASNIIPAGQGFFVQTSGSGSLTFTEGAKISTQASPLLMSTPVDNTLSLENVAVANVASPSIQSTPFTLVRLSITGNGLPYKEETAVVFQAGKSAAYNVTEDATYLSDASEQKLFLSSLSSDNRNLTINYMPEVANGSSVKLNVSESNKNGNYQLFVDYQNVPSGYLVKLNDSFLGTSTAVSSGYVHAFTIDKTQAASYGTNRFSVSFEAPTTLPVTYQSFTATKVAQGVLVKWTTLNEANNNRFELKRAGENQKYEQLYTELSKGTAGVYTFIDRSPLIGNNYYKLVQVDNDNKLTEIEPKVINYSGGVSDNAEKVSAYPNPVVANVTIRFNGVLAGAKQTLKVVNVSGQVLLTKTVAKEQLLAGYDLNLASYERGTYVVEIYDNGTQRVGQIKVTKQ